jgi:hypothetical protein
LFLARSGANGTEFGENAGNGGERQTDPDSTSKFIFLLLKRNQTDFFIVCLRAK